MINRAAILLKYKPPAVAWINEADPYYDDPNVTLQDVNSERVVYLISDAEAGTGNASAWIKANWRMLFENELEGWYTDPDLWPQKRTLKLFHAWFDVECHTIIEDIVGGPIFDEDI